MTRPLAAALLSACLGSVAPAAAQTVIYPSPPPRADSARPAPPAAGADTGRRDTTRASPPPYGITPAPAAPPRQAAPAAASPPPPPPIDPVLARACIDAAPGEAAPDVLGIVFESGTAPADREAALVAVEGKRLGGSAEDQFQYVQVPAGGSEFRLRALADKLIRRASVSEVGPVTCPARAAAPPDPAARAAQPDSAAQPR